MSKISTIVLLGLMLFLGACSNEPNHDGHLIRVTSPTGKTWNVCEETSEFRYGYGGVGFNADGGRVTVYGAIVEPIGRCDY